jgi:hypothetical protein
MDDSNNPLATPLPQGDNPVSEPDDIPVTDNQLDDTHPQTDTNVDITEEYDEGLSGAAEASEPNADNDVVDYDPKSK